MSIKKSLVRFGSRFAFEFFLETMHDPIVKSLRKYLSSIRVEDIPDMVRQGRFPPFEDLDFSAVSGNADHIQKISLLRLAEFLSEASPDLMKAIQDRGEAGAEYLAKLRVHLLEKLRQPDGGKEFELQEDTEMAHCDQCDKRWPVKKEEAAAITECPFCHAGSEGEEEPPSEEE